MKLTANQQAGHGYTITQFKTTNGGVSFGVLWYDTGTHSLGWTSPESAENFAEELYRRHFPECSKELK